MLNPMNEYQKIETMSTDEIGWEYAKLWLVCEREITDEGEKITGRWWHMRRMRELEDEHEKRPDREDAGSLTSFIECQIEMLKDIGIEVE